MMKVLYFDCSSGISGNMTLGALLEIVQDEQYLIQELDKLHVDGYHLEISKMSKNGIHGTYVNVILDEEPHHHIEHSHAQEHNHHKHTEQTHAQEHTHHHKHTKHSHTHDHTHTHSHTEGHAHRNVYDINHIIDHSDFNQEVKDIAKRIFLRVAKAESKVHNEPLDKVHFHEVGAIDSIIDIVGTAILIHKIKPDVIYSSVVNDGHGFIECAHGMIPVPVPATSEIFASSDVITRQIDIETELVTPTGAAIIAELASGYGIMPVMNVNQIGWGCGTKELSIPNVLKVSLGTTSNSGDTIIVMETNIDDCSGEIMGYVVEKLLQHNALDVFFTPLYMKKNRPAYCLSVLCERSDMEELQNIIFKETTTIGIRYRTEERVILERKEVVINTPYGDIQAKEVKHLEETYIYPEYESIKKVAVNNNLSIKEIYHVIK